LYFDGTKYICSDYFGGDMNIGLWCFFGVLRRLIAGVFIFVSVSISITSEALAQTAVVPDSGDLLQQQQTPLAPPSAKGKGLFKLEPPVPGSPGESFFVETISITGNSSIDEVYLRPLIGPYENRELMLSDLHLLCYEITEYYRSQGYLFSRAVVPQQEVEQGRLKLRVVEARLGQLIINNNSQVSTRFISRIVEKVTAKEIIKESPLNRSLLLLRDVVGVDVQASIRAGESLGLSDLQLDVTAVAPKHRISVNNYGSRLTRRTRLNGFFNFQNLAGQGDLLSLGVSGSGQRMKQLSVNYDIGLNGNGLYGGANVSYLDYALGENLKDLNAEGTARTAAVYLRGHWHRSLSANLSSQLRLQRQSLDDQINHGASVNRRDIHSANLSLRGDASNWLMAASVNSWQLDFTVGQVTYENEVAQQRDLITANNQGRFYKANLEFLHLQALSEKLQLSVRVSVQRAFDNLDSSQKKSLAGPYAVRAYDVGTLSGDTAFVSNLELQYDFDEANHGAVTIFGFVDVAKTEINDKPWEQFDDDNRISLSGAGLGLRWRKDGWHASGYAAVPISEVPSQLGNPKTGLLWFELAKAF